MNTANEPSTNGTAAPHTPRYTKKEDRQKFGKPLFSKKDKLDDEIQKLEAKLDELRSQRQEVAKEVYENLGAGPFTWNGEKVLIMRRKPKDAPDSETVFYFRGPSETQGESIG